MSVATAAWVAVVAPFVGAALTPVAARLGSTARAACALLFAATAAGAALRLLPGLGQPDLLPVETRGAWLDVPVRIDVGLLIDPLSIVLTNVVAVISFIILVYCVGYMRGDPAETRFWMWMNSFIGSMLLLVLANNLLFLFIGWKLVGVCSYGLIGFYYRDQKMYWIGGPAPAPFVTPSAASLKALLVTGAGDMLMLAGILLVYAHAGTLRFTELYATAPTWLASIAAQPGLMVVVSLLLLAGPLGKSAQFPFHEWLPEAMAGPGPVSALIHAATMVKSGVYLVARLVPLFAYGYWGAEIDAAGWFFTVTAWAGAFTAVLAATQGLVAVELKKVMAYSTVSQIGYMMLALGVAGLGAGRVVDGYTAAVFHLVSHALFKACLFLCAGTVIHAFHSIYITEMGAARRLLPVTWACMLVASLSLMGVPPLPGFWSKDAVLLVTLEVSPVLFAIGVLTAGLTAFYTVRAFVLVFHGPPPRHAPAGVAGRQDGDWTMQAASLALVVLIVVAGVGALALEGLLHHDFETSLAGVLAGTPTASEAGGASHLVVSVLSVLAVTAGAVPAYLLYGRGRPAPAILTGPVARTLHRFFWNRWGIETCYRRLFIDAPRAAAAAVAGGLEARWDRTVHHALPQVALGTTHRLLRWLRTDTEELVHNVSYILIVFGLLLTYLLLEGQ